MEIGDYRSSAKTDAEAYVLQWVRESFMQTREGPPRRSRAASSLSEVERAALMANVGLNAWNPDFDKVPDVGSAIFDFMPSASVRGRTQIRSQDFKDKKSVLLITTSLAAHFRLGEREDCFYLKIRDGKLVDPGFPVYDYTQVPPSCLRICQVSISGLALKHGQFNINARDLAAFIKRNLFDMEPGFQFDLCAVQVGTNDAAFGLRIGIKHKPGFPSTEDQFQREIEGAASELGLAFSRTVALLGAGSSSFKSPLPTRYRADLPIGAGLDPHVIHHAIHRMYLRSLVSSYEEIQNIGVRELTGVIHSPLSFYPGHVMQKGDVEKIGHVQARYYGDAAVDFSNCIQYGLVKRFPDFVPVYAVCPGLPTVFQSNLQDLTVGVSPDEIHCHFGDTAPCPGVVSEKSRTEGGKVGICWGDRDFTRILFGETVATAMYLRP
jgi:hypothetical protein